MDYNSINMWLNKIVYNSIMNYFKTTRESITDEKTKLNTLMREYDKWASRNPDKIVSSKKVGDIFYEQGKEFREFKQQIKLCKLRINELEEIERIHQNTPRRLDE